MGGRRWNIFVSTFALHVTFLAGLGRWQARSQGLLCDGPARGGYVAQSEHLHQNARYHERPSGYRRCCGDRGRAASRRCSAMDGETWSYNAPLCAVMRWPRRRRMLPCYGSMSYHDTGPSIGRWGGCKRRASSLTGPRTAAREGIAIDSRQSRCPRASIRRADARTRRSRAPVDSRVDVTFTQAVARGERCKRGWPCLSKLIAQAMMCSPRRPSLAACARPRPLAPRRWPTSPLLKPRAAHPTTVSASRTSASGSPPPAGGRPQVSQPGQRAATANEFDA
jgi:hypothetical protein